MSIIKRKKQNQVSVFFRAFGINGRRVVCNCYGCNLDVKHVLGSVVVRVVAFLIGLADM